MCKVKDNEYTPCKQGFTIERPHFFSLKSDKLFYLRTLLIYINSPTSYAEIIITNSVAYDTFKETY